MGSAINEILSAAVHVVYRGNAATFRHRSECVDGSANSVHREVDGATKSVDRDHQLVFARQIEGGHHDAKGDEL
jgi:hypothetical protein